MKSLPEEDALVGVVCLGAAFLGDSLLLANWDPTELSKKPPPEEDFAGEECLGAGAAFLGDSLLLANSEPTDLSKKPPPEEDLLGADGLGAVFLYSADLLANSEPTELSKNPFEAPAKQSRITHHHAAHFSHKHAKPHPSLSMFSR